MMGQAMKLLMCCVIWHVEMWYNIGVIYCTMVCMVCYDMIMVYEIILYWPFSHFATSGLKAWLGEQKVKAG